MNLKSPSSNRAYLNTVLLLATAPLVLATSCGVDSNSNSGWSFEEDADITPRCSADPLVSTYVLAGESEQRWTSSAPSISGGRVYFHKATDEKLQLFAQTIGSGLSEQLTRQEGGAALETAAGGLVLTQNPSSSRTEIQVRNTDGQLLDKIREIGVYGVEANGTRGNATAVFDGERILTEGAPTIRLFDVNGNLLAKEGSDGPYLPRGRGFLTRDGFAFTAARVAQPEDGSGPHEPMDFLPSELFVWNAQSQTLQLTESEANERHVWYDEETFYWVTEAAVFKGSVEGSSEKIYDGACGPPHALGGMAVFACAEPARADEESRQLHNEPIATQLYLHDGSDTRQIELDGDEGLIHSVRISKSGLAWFEFDDADTFCHGREVGRVMYHGFATNQVVQVGDVQAPCWCCDRNRTALVLDIGDGVVAWNYARPWQAAPPETDSYWRTSGFGYATIEPPSNCSEQ